MAWTLIVAKARAVMRSDGVIADFVAGMGTAAFSTDESKAAESLTNDDIPEFIYANGTTKSELLDYFSDETYSELTEFFSLYNWYIDLFDYIPTMHFTADGPIVTHW